MADPLTAPDQEAAHLEYAQLRAEVDRLQRKITRLHEEIRLGEVQYATAMRLNEQRRADNESLRRLLAAVLPPDALYQEARELTKRLREHG